MMKALVARDYGPPETLRVEEIPIPEPGPYEIQVRVRAASLNPADLVMTSGEVRDLARTDFPYVPGSDFAGTVTKRGAEVNRFEVGDEVFGFGAPPAFAEQFNVRSLTTGAMAEYATFRADGPFVATRPEGLSAELAAALSSTGMTALPVLAAVDVAPGERVLVIGAAGGIGSAVVPLLARDTKAHVIATTVPEDEGYVTRLGAAETIDYLAHDIAGEALRRHSEGVDAMVNLALNGEPLIAAANAIRRGGRLVSTTPGTPDQAAFTRPDLTVTMVIAPPKVGQDTFPTIAARALDGTLPDPISRRYRLDEADQAFRDLGSPEHTRGKLVVTTKPGPM